MGENIKLNAKELFEKFSSKDKKIKLFAALGIIGIVLILLSELVPSAESDKPKAQEDISYSEYISLLETETEQLISSIDGAGRCKVMITLKNSNESVYAKNTQENNSESSYSNSYEYVLYDGQNGESPVLIKQYFPSVQGVAVVCDGADNKAVRESIVNSIASLYNISVSKISVSKYKV